MIFGQMPRHNSGIHNGKRSTISSVVIIVLFLLLFNCYSNKMFGDIIIIRRSALYNVVITVYAVVFASLFSTVVINGHQ